MVVGECAAGFQIPALGLIVLYRGGDLRGPAPPRSGARKFQRGAAIAAFTDLAANDLVVHEEHGIGRYHGLRTLSVRAGTTPTSCCSSTPTAAGSTCPWSGST